MEKSNSFGNEDTTKKIEENVDSDNGLDAIAIVEPEIKRDTVTGHYKEMMTQKDNVSGEVKFRNMYCYNGSKVYAVNTIYCNDMSELMLVSKSWYNKKYHILEVETIDQLKEFEKHSLDFVVEKNDETLFSFYNITKIYGEATKAVPMILEKDSTEILRVLVVANDNVTEINKVKNSVNWNTIKNYLKDFIKENKII